MGSESDFHAALVLIRMFDFHCQFLSKLRDNEVWGCCCRAIKSLILKQIHPESLGFVQTLTMLVCFKAIKQTHSSSFRSLIVVLLPVLANLGCCISVFKVDCDCEWQAFYVFPGTFDEANPVQIWRTANKWDRHTSTGKAGRWHEWLL